MFAAAAGVAVGGVLLKLSMGRPHFEKQVEGAYAVPEGPEEGAPYHSALYPGELRSVPYPGCGTVYDVFQLALAQNGDRPAVGTRELIKARRQRGARGARGALLAAALRSEAWAGQ